MNNQSVLSRGTPDVQSSQHRSGTLDTCQPQDRLQNAARLEAHGREVCSGSAERAGCPVESHYMVTGGRSTSSPIPESAPRTPQTPSDGMPPYDPAHQSHSRSYRSTPTAVVQAASCGMILSTISFPFDQLTVLGILLPSLPRKMSWNDSDHIIRSVKNEWFRSEALRTLMSRLPQIMTVSEKDRVLQNFTSSYYRNRVTSLLDDRLDDMPESAVAAGASST